MKFTYPEPKLFINGQWRNTVDRASQAPSANTSIDVVNPSTDEVIGAVPVATTADLDDALAAAEAGFKIWSATPPKVRADLMRDAATLMRERIDQIAHTITCEHGKPFSQAKLEVIRACEFLEWDAGEAVRTYGRVIPSAPGVTYTVVHEPIGVVAAFSPWNFPVSQPARKIAGAIASGCSIILKPGEETPAGAMHVVQAFHDAGLPPGVLNLVFGVPQDISEHLISSPITNLVAFTGSTEVGRQLTVLASQHLTPVLMELGGHAPVIVCEDTDVSAAAASSATRAMRNAGQVCTSPTRFFVHEDVFDDFVEEMTAQSEAISVGDGFDDVEMGPLANPRRVVALAKMVRDAVECGAELLTGGSRIGDIGNFFEPTILANVPDHARIMQEEPFGPIAVINPVSCLDDAIVQANSVPYGLAAYGFTNRADYVHELTTRVEAGNLSINTLEASLPETPFGGVKWSGFGREGGAEGLDHYTTVKNISHSIKIV